MIAPKAKMERMHDRAYNPTSNVQHRAFNSLNDDEDYEYESYRNDSEEEITYDKMLKANKELGRESKISEF